MLSIILVLILILLTWCCMVLQKKYNYWNRRNVPQSKHVPLLGDYQEFILQKKINGKIAQDLCKQFPNEPFVGAYFGTEPALIVQDPELIKLITTKDFHYFYSREIQRYARRETMSKNMFHDEGDSWKVTRQNMSPLFSSAKMKNMFYLIEQCAHSLETMFDDLTSKCSELEIRELMARYTINCICSCAFGIDPQSLDNVEENIFVKMGEMIFEVSHVRAIKHFIRLAWPSIFYGLGIKIFPDSLSDFFQNMISGIFSARRNKPTSRNDFIDLLLNLKQNQFITGDSIKRESSEKLKIEVTDEFLVAQCIVFFGAGFETSSNTTSFTLYELAKNKKAQTKAAQEVEKYLQKNNGKLTYECVNELPYLTACVSEAMRLYPVLGLITREVVEDYTLPTGLRLEKGLRIHLPVWHLHRNPENFPEPNQYQPERFVPENKHNIKPYTYLPFGEGQRICIGMRFAWMQVLSGLITVLKKYNVELADGMPHNLDFEVTAFVTQAKRVALKLTPREGWESQMFSKEMEKRDETIL